MKGIYLLIMRLDADLTDLAIGRHYLRPHVTLIESWGIATTAHLESCWACRLATTPEIRVPVPGFGASDSDFTSHLLYSGARPARHLVVEALMDCFLHQQTAEFTLELRSY